MNKIIPQEQEFNIASINYHLDAPVSSEELEQAIRSVRADKIKNAAKLAVSESNIDRWKLVDEMTIGNSKITRQNYGYYLKVFFKWLDGPGPGNLLSMKSSDAAQYVRFLMVRYKPNSVRTMTAACKALYSMLIRDEYKTGNPFANIKMPKKEYKVHVRAAKGEKPILNKNDIAMICDDAANRHDDIGNAVLILANYGLRLGALNDLLITKKSYLTATTKGGFIVRMSPDEIGGDGGLLEALPPKPFGKIRSDIGLRRGVQEYLKKFECTPHDLRHAFAVIHYNRLKDVYSVKRLLGHQSVATTESYLQSIGLIIK